MKTDSLVNLSVKSESFWPIVRKLVFADRIVIPLDREISLVVMLISAWEK